MSDDMEQHAKETDADRRWAEAYRKHVALSATHVANRRTAEAVAQIEEAREEPTSGLHMADYDGDRRARPLRDTELSAFRGIDPTPPDTLTLSGTKLAAYRQLEAAAAAAHAAQETMAVTGTALREAIQAMCAAIAPGKVD